MANYFKVLLKEMFGKEEEISEEEIKKAEQSGEIAASSAAKRVGIVEQVEIDANAAREAAQLKLEKQEEKTEEEK